MPRFALPAALAALAWIGAGQAVAAPVTTAVDGEVRALSLSANALNVARQPARGLLVERIVAGSPAQVVLRTTLRGDDDQVALASSEQAIAIALNESGNDRVSPGRVMIGPALGPLREVGFCETGLNAAPIAVAGTRIAWREGGCGVPASGPRGVSPSEVVIAGADPSAVVRRLSVSSAGLPVSLVLAPGDIGLLGLLQPSFFLIDTEVRAFSPAGFGPVVAAEQGAIVLPVGLLSDGTRILLAQKLEEEQTTTCDDAQVFALAPGSSERRTIALGGCAVGETTDGPLTGTGPLAGGDRITALVRDRSDSEQPVISVVSVRADGGDRRVVARGRLRAPQGIAADGQRVAWWQPRCRGGSEVVVQEGLEGPTTTAACRVTILTRRARARNGRIAVRVRCPVGCRGAASTGRRILQRAPFAFGPGTHTLRVPAPLRGRRSARMRLELTVEHGPPRAANIRVRR